MTPITVSILPDGTVRFLVTEESRSMLGDDSLVTRASHVEPCSRLLRVLFYLIRTRYADNHPIAAFTRLWPCLWRINLSPVNGPILPDTYRNRKQAIKAEVLWLTVTFL